MADEFTDLLQTVCFHPSATSPHPFYLVQLSDKSELELNGQLVSDALAALLLSKPYTHVFLQTHGWNTPPDKAVKIPFGQFMAGMQDDPTMPSDPSFLPLFVAFTWEALPLKFLREKDALTRTELFGDALAECEMEDATATEAAKAAASAARGSPIAEFGDRLRSLAASARNGLHSNDKDKEADEIVSRAVATADETGAGGAADEVAERAVRLPKVVQNVLNPVQRLLFGRLIERGVATGVVLRGVMAKLMRARRAKYCLMANSLGAHVLAGALVARGELPFKAHTAFFVQGACNRDWFGPDGRYAAVARQVAGPVVCTTSVKDTMLSRVFEPFHGFALGSRGFPEGVAVNMLPREAQDPYPWQFGAWNSVDGSDFIDEWTPVAGGHGDFKEDETTMTYWSAINTEVGSETYEFPEPLEGREDGGGPGGFIGGLFGAFQKVF